MQDIHNHHHDDHDDVSVPTCNAGSDFSDSSGDSHDLEQTNEFHRHYSQQDSSGLNMLTDIASSDQVILYFFDGIVLKLSPFRLCLA